MSRVVLDTNVVFAAFAARGLCESVFELSLERHDLFISDHLVGELRSKLHDRLKMPVGAVEDIVELYSSQATLLTPVELPPDTCRDPDDVAVLGLALAASADYIVTGDKDLLSLEKFTDIPIVTPRAFHDLQ